MKPQLSIIVPVYNTEQYLDECLRSLIAQTLNDIEIILIDDGSTDSSSEICDRYALIDSRIKVLHKKNEGLGIARNTGLRESIGDFVTFCDSDDIVDHNTYKVAINVAKKHNADIVRFGYKLFLNEENINYDKELGKIRVIDNPKTLQIVSANIFSEPLNLEEKNLTFSGSACMAIWKNTIIKENKISFLSERKYISEDYLFTFEYMQYIKKFAYIDSHFYFYRKNPTSTSSCLDLNKISKAESFCLYVEELFRKYELPKNLYNKIYGYYITIFRLTMDKIIESNIGLSEKRKLFYSNTDGKYFKKVVNYYPWKKLKWNKALFVFFTKYQFFYLTYFSIKAFNSKLVQHIKNL